MDDLEMIRGLVRAAELLEQRDGGKIWDDEARMALDHARELGWGKHTFGKLKLPTEHELSKE